MAELLTSVPEEERRTEGPDGALFLSGGLPEGYFEIERQELIGPRGSAAYGVEKLEVVTFPGVEEPGDDGLLLQWSAWDNHRRLVSSFGMMSMELGGERFQISCVRESDGTPGGLVKHLREQYELPDYWVKAKPWPFPVPFRMTPREIDVRAVAEELGCEAVMLRDPNATLREPTEQLLVPIFPGNR